MAPQHAWERIGWFDAETTGLDVGRDLLLEGSLSVTDAELNVLARETVSIRWTREEIEGYYAALVQEYFGFVKGTPWEGDFSRPVDVMKITSEERKRLPWSFVERTPGIERERLRLVDQLRIRDQHEASGLFADCAGRRSLTLEEADARFVSAMGTGLRGTKLAELPLGGCSPFLDRAMAERDLPRLASYFSRRTVDVSCLRNALRSWAGTYPEPAEKYGHRAEADVAYAIGVARRVRGWIKRGAKLIGQDDERRAAASSASLAS